MKTTKFGKSLAAIAVFCLVAGASMAQDAAMREHLFRHADAQFEDARAAGVDVLAPKGYANALKYYKRAETKFIRGEDVDSIRGGVARARAELRRATEAAGITEVTLSASLRARFDAKSADAAKFAPKLWEMGEEKITWAVSRLEGGSIKQAQSLGADAEKIFRDAELASIKANHLTKARNLLAQAKQARVERYAPKTLDRARRLLSQAEWELADSRYDLEVPRNLAREAQYEASHAIYLASVIQNAKTRKVELEDLLLDLETPVKDIGSSLDIVVQVDRGYQEPTAQITRQIAELRASSETTDALRDQVERLEEELSAATQN